MPVLIVRPGGGQPFRVPLEGERCRVGRASGNELRLRDDLSISRFHAEFVFRDGAWWVHDAGSTHGTLVNGQAINGLTRLREGDEVQVGQSSLRLAPDGAGAEEPSPPPPLPGNTIAMPLADIMSSTFISAGGVTLPEGKAEAETPQSRAFGILSRAAESLLAHQPLDQVLQGVMDMVFEACSPERAAILLLQGEPPELSVQAERGVGGRIQVSRTISELVIRGKQAIITQDAQVDERLAGSDSVMMQGIRSALCAPLWNNREVIGLVYLDSVAGRGSFTRDDLQVVTLLANVAAVKIENERLFLRDQAMREMEKELSAAARIQQRLLPLTPPEVPGYELVGMNVPCRAVGGDTFDFQPRGSGRLGIVLGDVAGKGMGAALIMAMFQAVFRAHAGADVDLLDLVSRLNRTVCDNAEPGKFITVFCADLDPATHRLQFVNAGHNPPLLVEPDGRVRRLHTGGIILGFSTDAVYKEEVVDLQPGSVLLMYSDGITEARNREGEEYGEARLVGVLSASNGRSVTEIRDRVVASVNRFTGGGEQEDDMTLSLLKRISP